MSFKAVLKLVNVAPDSSSFVIKDETLSYNATTNPTGFGGPEAPLNLAAVSYLQVQKQLFGSEPVLVSYSNISGSLLTGLKVDTKLEDGVTLIHALYGVVNGLTFAAMGKLLIFTGSSLAFSNAFTGVGYIAATSDPSKLFRIKSINVVTQTVELYTAWTTGNTIIKYYDSVTRILVLNCGQANLVKDIANMAISNTGCNIETTIPLLNRTLLKFGAETFFNCGNYAKAHNAATLLCSKSSTQPCASC